MITWVYALIAYLAADLIVTVAMTGRTVQITAAGAVFILLTHAVWITVLVLVAGRLS